MVFTKKRLPILQSYGTIEMCKLDRQNITILISDGERCITLTDGGELAIQKSADSGSRRYTVGYFGDSKSQQLCEAILSILEKEET